MNAVAGAVIDQYRLRKLEADDFTRGQASFPPPFSREARKPAPSTAHSLRPRPFTGRQIHFTLHAHLHSIFNFYIT